MNTSLLIKIALAATLAAASSHKLLQFIAEVQQKQLKLLEDSRTSSWGKLIIVK